MVVVLSGEAVASHASFVYQPKPADPEEVELAASAKSFLWRKAQTVGMHASSSV